MEIPPTIHVSLLTVILVIGIGSAFWMLLAGGRRRYGVYLLAGLIGLGAVATGLKAVRSVPMRGEAQWRHPRSVLPDRRLNGPDGGGSVDRPVPVIWDEAVGREFATDSYPTVEDAVVGLACLLAGQAGELAGDIRSLRTVYLAADIPGGAAGNVLVRVSDRSYRAWGGSVRIDRDLLEKAGLALGDLFKGVDIRFWPEPTGEGPPDLGDEIAAQALKLTFSISRVKLPDIRSVQSLGEYHIERVGGLPGPIEGEAEPQAGRMVPVSPFEGELKVRMDGPRGYLSQSAVFFNKPWVTRPGDLANRYPEYRWYVAYSRDAAVNDSEQARRQAVREAAAWVAPQLAQAVSARMAIAGGASGKRPDSMSLDEDHLKAYGFWVDSYCQQLRGTAGPIWRQAILLGIGPDGLAAAANSLVKEEQGLRRRYVEELVQLGWLVALVFVLYLFLNYATKGYYSLMLKLLAGVVLAGAIMSVLFWA